MPELPEVEIQRRNLAAWWEGRVFDSVDALDDKVVRTGALDGLAGRGVEEVERRGKYILVHMTGTDEVCIVHSRMTGKIIPVDSGDVENKRVRATFTTDDGEVYGFVDTRRLGHIDVVPEAKIDELGVLGELGPEPWPTPLTGEKLRERLGSTRRAIKTALLDQSVIAGVGNIVSCESLWLAQLNPRRKSNTLEEDELDALGGAICQVCEETIAAEEGEEVVYFNDPAAEAKDNPFAVYKREGEPCPECGGEIERFKQSGRSTFWCPACQGGS